MANLPPIDYRYACMVNSLTHLGSRAWCRAHMIRTCHGILLDYCKYNYHMLLMSIFFSSINNVLTLTILILLLHIQTVQVRVKSSLPSYSSAMRDSSPYETLLSCSVSYKILPQDCFVAVVSPTRES